MNRLLDLRAVALICIFIPLIGRPALAQDKLQLSGYVQPQFQYGGPDAMLKVGSANNLSGEAFNRIGIRRGRIKLTYEETPGTAVIQVDVSERGVIIKDVYLNLKDPWWQAVALRAGIFEPPFGNEIEYSSTRRESPESSLLYQTLFPEERDMGAMVQLRPPASSPLHCVMLDAALLAGNGAKMETDNRKDFTAHLHFAHDAGHTFRVAGGVSYYNGGVYQGGDAVYRMAGETFAADSRPQGKGGFAKREYRGIDLQLNMLLQAWARQVRAEYIVGSQPGSATESRSHNASTLPVHDTYIRHFRGGYVIFVQDMAASPFAAALKYEWYDPNTHLANDAVGLNNTGAADICRRTFGFGMIWQPDARLRLQTYYEINRNETSGHLAGYERDRDDNVLTLRLQYKF
jgi:phosphate-selective porin